MSQDRWFAQGSPEFAKVSFVEEMIDSAARVVGYDPGAVAGGFISFMSRGWALLPEDQFESDLAELVKGLRLARADVQARGKMKS